MGLLFFWVKTVVAIVSFLAVLLESIEAVPRVLKVLQGFATDSPNEQKLDWRNVMTFKRVLIVAVLFVASLGFAAWAYTDEANPFKKTIVAVPPFVNITEHNWLTTKRIPQEDGSTKEVNIDQLSLDGAFRLRGILVNSDELKNKITVINEQELVRSLEAIHFSKTGLVDQDAQLEIGKMLAANTDVLGKITHITLRLSKLPGGFRSKTAEVTVAIEVYKRETRKVVYANTYTAKPPADLKKEGEEFDDKDLIIKALSKALQEIAKDKKFLSVLSD